MKKGISALIATVLIIGFTIAIAAIILTWGTGYFKGLQKDVGESSEEQTECLLDVGFDVTCEYDKSDGATKYSIINNKGSVLLTTQARFYDVNNNLLSSEAGPTNVAAYGTAADTMALATGHDAITAEVMASKVTSSTGKTLNCGTIASGSAKCTVVP